MDANNIIQSAFSGLTTKDTANAEAVAEMLERFGLRWDVQKESLLLPDGVESGYYAVVRQDTRKPFAAVKDTYHPYQNSELAELLIRVSEKTGYAIKNGGMFDGGSKVYLQLDTGNRIGGIGVNSDEVRGFATAINSHDGSTALRWGTTSITISCQNTFNRAYKGLYNSAKHSSRIRDRVDESLRNIEIVLREETDTFGRFMRMASTPSLGTDIVRVVKSVTGVDLKRNEESSTYAQNRAKELLSSITSEMQSKGNTMWGLFSGVTHYTTHKMPAPKRDEGRLESKFMGTGLAVDNTIFSMLN
jgi:phage/plasmid-like protein (TIGR03299 family)